jgi:hypothetical protein
MLPKRKVPGRVYSPNTGPTKRRGKLPKAGPPDIANTDTNIIVIDSDDKITYYKMEASKSIELPVQLP